MSANSAGPFQSTLAFFASMADSLKDAVRADAFRKLEIQDDLADPYATPERKRQHSDDDSDSWSGRKLLKTGQDLEAASEEPVVLDSTSEERNVGPPAPAAAESKVDPADPAAAESAVDTVPPGPPALEIKENPSAPAVAESRVDQPVRVAAESKENPPAPIPATATAVPSLLSPSRRQASNEFFASDDDRDLGEDSDALKRPAACKPKAQAKSRVPRPMKRPAARVSRSPDDEADAVDAVVLKKPAASAHVAAGAPAAAPPPDDEADAAVLKKPAASAHVAAGAPAAALPRPGSVGDIDTWDWVAVDGQQHLRECLIGDWKARIKPLWPEIEVLIFDCGPNLRSWFYLLL